MMVSPISPGMLKPDGTVDVAALQLLLNDLRNAALSLWAGGTVAQRPTDPYLGQLFYDTTTGQYFYCSAVRSGATPAVWTAITPATVAGGASQSQQFSATGAFTFNVPANVSLVWVTLQAPGGQGNKNASGGGGAGAGELIRHYPYLVTPGAAIAGVIGTGATSNVSVDSTFGTLTAKGGKGGATTTAGQAGGGSLGASGSGSAGVSGTQILDVLGGSSGGALSTKGGDCGQNSGGAAGGTAGGGGASYFAPGGQGAPAATPLKPGPGAGGGGTATGANGGQGGDGYCLIEWIG